MLNAYQAVILVYVLAFGCIWGHVRTITYLTKRYQLDSLVTIILGIVVFGVLCESAFFAYFYSRLAGTILSALFLLSVLLNFGFLLCRCWRKPRHFTEMSRSLSVLPFLFAGMFGALYLTTFYIHSSQPDVININDMPNKAFFEMDRPPDNVLPYNFAFDVLKNSPKKIGVDNPVTGWSHSERPPLQAGAVLLFAPLKKFTNPVLYQAVGTALQVLIFAAIYLLCQVLKLTRRECILVMMGIGYSGFFYYNSIYVWPKMVAAAFFIFSLLLPLRSYLTKRPLTRFEFILTAMTSTLAFLSHGGSVYSIIPFGILLLLQLKKIVSCKNMMYGVLIALLMYSPWVIYTKYIDTSNHNKLLVLHLTDQNPDAEVYKPFSETLLTSYRNKSWNNWLADRRSNVTRLFGNNQLDIILGDLTKGMVKPGQYGNKMANVHRDLLNIVDSERMRFDFSSLANVLRIDQREHIFRTLDILNVAWPLLLLAALFQHRKKILDRGIVALFVLNLLTILVWSILQFNDGSTVTTHSSYAMIVIFFVLAITIITRCLPRCAPVIIGLHMVFNILIWVWFMPTAHFLPISQFNISRMFGALILGFISLYVSGKRNRSAIVHECTE